MSKLTGVMPSKIEQRFKCFVYGDAGVGKTTFALQFPSPYYIDCENKTRQNVHLDMLEAAGGLYCLRTDYDGLYAEIMALATEKHRFKTVIIDSITVPYKALVEDCFQATLSKAGAEDARRAYGLSGRKINQLVNLLLKADMNVIMIAHSKNVSDETGKVISTKFDADAKLPYMFDVVLEVQKVAGDKRIGIVRKTSGDMFKGVNTFDFSYEEVKKVIDSCVIDKDAVPLAKIDAVSLKTLEVLEMSLSRAMHVKSVSDDYVKKCFDSLSIKDLSEISEAQAMKWIEALDRKNREAVNVNIN